jgi:hypothetical protein
MAERCRDPESLIKDYLFDEIRGLSGKNAAAPLLPPVPATPASADTPLRPLVSVSRPVKAIPGTLGRELLSWLLLAAALLVGTPVLTRGGIQSDFAVRLAQLGIDGYFHESGRVVRESAALFWQQGHLYLAAKGGQQRVDEPGKEDI